MRKYMTCALALALVAAMLGGCRRNVSNDRDGMITEPATTTTTTATMPSTDTAPTTTTQPHASTGETVHPGNGTATQGTEHTNPTDHTASSSEPGTERSYRPSPRNIH